LTKPHVHSARSVVLLGPGDDVARIGAHAGRVLAELGLLPDSHVALVTAGWQEREGDDDALQAALGVRCTNLRLHARSEKIFIKDHALSTAYKARQERLRHMQVFYRTRLESADDAARHIALRHVDPGLIAEEWDVSIALFRQLDVDHLARCQRVYADFDAEWRPLERDSVRADREALAELVRPAEALVIAGGHVGSLLNRLRLFDVLGLTAHLPVVAWAAGAMVLTERIVCFHDYPPYGKDIAQLLDAGLGLAPGVVVLPNPGGARRRLNLDEHAGIGRFARRMAPAECLAMGPDAELRFAKGKLATGRATWLGPAGEVDAGWHHGRAGVAHHGRV